MPNAYKPGQQSDYHTVITKPFLVIDYNDHNIIWYLIYDQWSLCNYKSADDFILRQNRAFSFMMINLSPDCTTNDEYHKYDADGDTEENDDE